MLLVEPNSNEREDASRGSQNLGRIVAIFRITEALTNFGVWDDLGDFCDILCVEASNLATLASIRQRIRDSTGFSSHGLV